MEPGGGKAVGTQAAATTNKLDLWGPQLPCIELHKRLQCWGVKSIDVRSTLLQVQSLLY